MLLLSALEYTDGRLGSFKLPCNLFGIIRIVYDGNITTQFVFGCHIIVSSPFKAVYFWGFLVMAIWRRSLLATAT